MSRLPIAFILIAATLVTACGGAVSDDTDPRPHVHSTALSAEQRLAACAQDPRVVTGLASAEVCAGAGIFFEETFLGNGRTCGSCHPAANNLTIDPAFIATLPASDPLFVFETDPALAALETSSLRSGGGVLENV